MDGLTRGPPPVVRIRRFGQISSELTRHGVTLRRPVVVLVGGAGGMDQDGVAALDGLLRKAILPTVNSVSAAVVDGGTDSGVMRAAGRAREATGAAFPLVGVAAEGTVQLPGSATSITEAAQLEPHHTLIVLVPGSTWGDESPWIAHVAGVIAAGKPSVTLLSNGGDTAFEDVSNSLRHHRPVVVLSGTGRAADAIAAARRGSHTDPRADVIARSELTSIVPIHDTDEVRATVASALS